MKDFEFQIPTKIIFGRDTVSRIGVEAKAYGKKVMFVYGKSSIKRSGMYDRVIESLREAGLEIVEFPGVKPNPVLSHLHMGIELGKKEKVEFILGVGGGSVLDEAKAIAAGVMTERDVWDFFDGMATIKDALPVLTILTLPATGSEMNGGSVITNEETKQKYGFIDSHLCPKVSILDPTLTFSVTPEYTAYSAVDAFSHLTEGYFTHKAEWVPLQDRYVEGLVKTIIESTERILKDPEDYNARATMMWAASLAWNGLGTAGIGDFGVPAHMLEHSLSAIYDIAHGAGLSIVIPAWMKYALKEGNITIAKFAENVFDIRTGSYEEKAQKGIAALKDWFEKIGSPTSFSAANIPAADIDIIAENARMTAELWGLTDYTKEIIAKIYRMCL